MGLLLGFLGFVGGLFGGFGGFLLGFRGFFLVGFWGGGGLLGLGLVFLVCVPVGFFCWVFGVCCFWWFLVGAVGGVGFSGVFACVS